MADKWLTVNDFCAKYGVNRRSIFHWKSQGKIRFVKRTGRVFIHDPGYLDNITTAPNEIKEIDRFPMFRGLEIAKFLGVTPRAVRYLAEHNQLGFRKIGRRRRYSVEDVRKLIAFRENSNRATTGKQRREVLMRFLKQRLAQNP